jgi:CheY-like chemotaxis protein
MTVRVKVIKVQHNGIVVDILEMNRQGFIRWRDLSWDRRVGYIPPVPEIGAELEALLIEDKKGSRYAYLSVRDLTNPWDHVRGTYQVGQVVRGEVVNVRRFGVFAQIEPGIDATIYPKDIPLQRDQPTADVLSIGDQVQGVIVELDSKNRRMILGLIQRLQELDSLFTDRWHIQCDIFENKLSPTKIVNVLPTSATINNKSDLPLRRYYPPIPQCKRLLVVEDSEADLRRICDHLRTRKKVDTDGVRSGEEALNKVKEDAQYDLAVIEAV